MELYSGYESSTHQPLIKAVLSLYKPEFILELGCGIYSTPLFKNENYLGIENDYEWVIKMRGMFSDMSFIHHDIGRIEKGTFLNELTEKEKIDISNYYGKIKVNSKNSLLFVDNFTACRTIAINRLSKKFNSIMFHDCQPEGINWYNYNLIDSNGFTSYFLKTPTSWTCLMVRKDKGFSKLKEAVNIPIKYYLEEWRDCKQMYITNEY